MCKKQKQLRPEEAISNARALRTVNGDLTAPPFLLLPAKGKVEEEVEPEILPRFHSVAKAPNRRFPNPRTISALLSRFTDVIDFNSIHGIANHFLALRHREGEVYHRGTPVAVWQFATVLV